MYEGSKEEKIQRKKFLGSRTEVQVRKQGNIEDFLVILSNFGQATCTGFIMSEIFYFVNKQKAKTHLSYDTMASSNDFWK